MIEGRLLVLMVWSWVDAIGACPGSGWCWNQCSNDSFNHHARCWFPFTRLLQQQCRGREGVPVSQYRGYRLGLLWYGTTLFVDLGSKAYVRFGIIRVVGFRFFRLFSFSMSLVGCEVLGLYKFRQSLLTLSYGSHSVAVVVGGTVAGHADIETHTT